MSSRMSAPATALAVLFAVVAPSTAAASTAAVAPNPGDPAADVLTYRAAAGEANDVVVRPEAGGWILQDRGAAVTAGGSCVAIDAHTVQCRRTARPLELIRVELGDGDDAATWVAPIGVDDVVVDGGPGDDRLAVASVRDAADAILSGGPGRDRLDGGAGRSKVMDGGAGDDRLTGGTTGYADMRGGAGDDLLVGTPGTDDLAGGGGRDRLFGRGGSDRLSDGDRPGDRGGRGPDADVLDGGPGLHDGVSYRRRRAAVRVDLADGRPANGERGEGDRLRGIEDVVTGRGDDRLAGDGHANSLDAGRGSDRVSGRGGDDRLVTEVQLLTGTDRISCGRGADRIPAVAAHAGLSIAPDCEGFEYPPAGSTLTPYPRFAGGRPVYRVHCPVDEGDDGVTMAPCSGTVRMREKARPHRLLAAGAFPEGEWRRRPVPLRLTPAGRALARAGGTVAAVVTFRPRGTPFASGPRRWTIRLRL